MAVQDVETDFNFYLRFAKPLVLNLCEPNDRALAAAWIQKLRDTTVASEELRTNYLKLLLFVLQRQNLIGPFSENPNEYQTLENLPTSNLHDVAKQLLESEEKHRKQKVKKGKAGPSGDFPPYSIEYSADLLEYSAAQDIPNFGVHAYYAISKEPLTNWLKTENANFPRGMAMTIALEKTAISSIHARLQDKTPKSDSPEMKKKSPSPEKRIKIQSLPSLQLSSGETQQEGEREPPNWGSNLIGVTDPPTQIPSKLASDNFLHTSNTSYLGSPLNLPDLITDDSSAFNKIAESLEESFDASLSLPYRKSPSPKSSPKHPALSMSYESLPSPYRKTPLARRLDYDLGTPGRRYSPGLLEESLDLESHADSESFHSLSYSSLVDAEDFLKQIDDELDDWDRKIAEMEANYEKEVLLYGIPNEEFTQIPQGSSASQDIITTANEQLELIEQVVAATASPAKRPPRRQSKLPQKLSKLPLKSRPKSRLPLAKQSTSSRRPASPRSPGWDFEEQEKRFLAESPSRHSQRRRQRPALPESVREAAEIQRIASEQENRLPRLRYRQSSPRTQALKSEYEEYKKRYQHRLPGMPRTPPLFSRFRSLLETGDERPHQPSEFGLTEDIQWQPAESYFGNRTTLSPRVDERERRYRLFPQAAETTSEEYFFLQETMPEFVDLDDDDELLLVTETMAKLPTDDYFNKLSPAERSPTATTEENRAQIKRIKKDLTTIKSSIPAEAGVPLTTPKPAPSPMQNLQVGTISETGEIIWDSPNREQIPIRQSSRIEFDWQSPPKKTKKTATFSRDEEVRQVDTTLGELLTKLEQDYLLKTEEIPSDMMFSPPPLSPKRAQFADFDLLSNIFQTSTASLQEKQFKKIRRFPKMDTVYEHPITVPNEEVWPFTYPDDLMGEPTFIEWETSFTEIDDSFDKSNLPSPLKPDEMDIRFGISPPRKRKRTKITVLPGEAENVRVKPTLRDILHFETEPDLNYSPPLLSPTSTQDEKRFYEAHIAAHRQRELQRQRQQSANILEETEEPFGDIDFSETPPRAPSPQSPGSPNSPRSILREMYDADDPPYFSRPSLSVNVGRTRTKTKIVRAKASPPKLHSLREDLEQMDPEELPFYAQVEGANTNWPLRKPIHSKIISIHPRVDTIEEHPYIVPNQPRVLPYPQDLYGELGFVDYEETSFTELDRSFDDNLLQPPMQTYEHQSQEILTPPRRARREQMQQPVTLPEFGATVRLNPSMRDILEMERVPADMILSPPPLSPTSLQAERNLYENQISEQRERRIQRQQEQEAANLLSQIASQEQLLQTSAAVSQRRQALSRLPQRQTRLPQRQSRLPQAVNQTRRTGQIVTEQERRLQAESSARRNLQQHQLSSSRSQQMQQRRRHLLDEIEEPFSDIDFSETPPRDPSPRSPDSPDSNRSILREMYDADDPPYLSRPSLSVNVGRTRTKTKIVRAKASPPKLHSLREDLEQMDPEELPFYAQVEGANTNWPLRKPIHSKIISIHPRVDTIEEHPYIVPNQPRVLPYPQDLYGELGFVDYEETSFTELDRSFDDNLLQPPMQTYERQSQEISTPPRKARREQRQQPVILPEFGATVRLNPSMRDILEMERVPADMILSPPSLSPTSLQAERNLYETQISEQRERRIQRQQEQEAANLLSQIATQEQLQQTSAAAQQRRQARSRLPQRQTRLPQRQSRLPQAVNQTRRIGQIAREQANEISPPPTRRRQPTIPRSPGWDFEEQERRFQAESPTRRNSRQRQRPHLPERVQELAEIQRIVREQENRLLLSRSQQMLQRRRHLLDEIEEPFFDIDFSETPPRALSPRSPDSPDSNRSILREMYDADDPPYLSRPSLSVNVGRTRTKTKIVRAKASPPKLHSLREDLEQMDPEELPFYAQVEGANTNWPLRKPIHSKIISIHPRVDTIEEHPYIVPNQPRVLPYPQDLYGELGFVDYEETSFTELDRSFDDNLLQPPMQTYEHQSQEILTPPRRARREQRHQPVILPEFGATVRLNPSMRDILKMERIPADMILSPPPLSPTSLQAERNLYENQISEQRERRIQRQQEQEAANLLSQIASQEQLQQTSAAVPQRRQALSRLPQRQTRLPQRQSRLPQAVNQTRRIGQIVTEQERRLQAESSARRNLQQHQLPSSRSQQMQQQRRHILDEIDEPFSDVDFSETPPRAPSPRSPGSPDSPRLLFREMYDADDPPYLSQPALPVNVGRTRTKTRIVRAKASPPKLHSLREDLEQMDPEELPFYAQVEGANTNWSQRKPIHSKIISIHPRVDTIEEHPYIVPNQPRVLPYPQDLYGELGFVDYDETSFTELDKSLPTESLPAPMTPFLPSAFSSPKTPTRKRAVRETGIILPPEGVYTNIKSSLRDILHYEPSIDMGHSPPHLSPVSLKRERDLYIPVVEQNMIEDIDDQLLPEFDAVLSTGDPSYLEYEDDMNFFDVTPPSEYASFSPVSSPDSPSDFRRRLHHHENVPYNRSAFVTVGKTSAKRKNIKRKSDSPELSFIEEIDMNEESLPFNELFGESDYVDWDAPLTELDTTPPGNLVLPMRPTEANVPEHMRRFLPSPKANKYEVLTLPELGQEVTLAPSKRDIISYELPPSYHSPPPLSPIRTQPRSSSRRYSWELPKPDYYASPGREYIRTPKRKSKSPKAVETITIEEETWEFPNTIPFANQQGGPFDLDTSLIDEDLDNSFIEDQAAGWKWMD